MADDSGFVSSSQDSNPWQSTGGPSGLGGGFSDLGLGFGTGFGAGFGSPPAGPAAQTDRAAPTGELVLGRDTRGQAAALGGTQAKEEAQQRGTLPSREDLLANPEKYGKPPGVDISPEDYARQYLHEVLSSLSYKDPRLPEGEKGGYTKQDRAFLESWGYGMPTQDVRGDGQNGNPATGLYAVRFDPKDSKSGLPPIVSFRGTEPDTLPPRDLVTDILDPSVGARQYEGQQAQIAQLLQTADGSKVELSGHSLGGALAQRAAADNADRISAITTFQAPGIAADAARRFDAANADGHIKVAHHFVSNDIVHRAGEKKIGGDFYEHHVPNRSPLSFLDSHTSNLLYDSGNGVNIDQKVGQRDSITHSTTDPTGQRRIIEGLRQTVGGGLGLPIEGLIWGGQTAGMGLWDGIKQVGGGLANAGNAISNGFTGGATAAWDGAKQGGSEIASGVGNLLSDPLGGLGEIGSGLYHGAGGLLGGAAQSTGGLLQGGWEGIKGIGGGLWSAGKGLTEGVGYGLGGLWGGARSIYHGAQNLAIGVGENALAATQAIGGSALRAAGEVGTGLSNGFNTLVDGTGSALVNTGQGLVNAAGNTVAGVGQGAQTAWQGMQQGGGQIGQGLNDLVHLRGKGFGEVGRGLVSGAGGLVQGGLEAGGSVLSGIGSGAVALGKGALDTGSAALHAAGDVGMGVLRAGGSIARDAGNAIGGAAKAGWEGAKGVAHDVGRFGRWLIGR